MMHRKNGGHVGIVSGIDEKGNRSSFPATAWDEVYPRSRVYAYVTLE